MLGVGPLQTVVLGSLAGLSWAAAMRGWMIEIAGNQSAFTWVGTFGFVVVPGTVVGGLLGWSAALQRQGVIDPARRKLLIASPLLLATALADPSNLARIVATGEGTGALGIVGIGMLGGYALGAHGRRAVRVGAGAVAAALTFAVGAASLTLGEGLSSPRGVWAALLAMSLVAMFGVACALPHRLAHNVTPPAVAQPFPPSMRDESQEEKWR